MDQGLSGGSGRKKPVTRAQLKKQQKAYQQADRIRMEKEKHHLSEEIEAEKLVDAELSQVDAGAGEG